MNQKPQKPQPMSPEDRERLEALIMETAIRMKKDPMEIIKHLQAKLKMRQLQNKG